MSNRPRSAPSGELSTGGRYVVVVTAFLGWMFAGAQMAITPLVNRSAVLDMLWPGVALQSVSDEQQEAVAQWLSFNLAGFLLGAALGGLLLGWLGDRAGRAKAMALAILLYSLPCGICYFARTPGEMLILRCIGGLGLGGMWPNGIALVTEAWSGVSRLTLSGLIGTAANVGIVLAGIVGIYYQITPESWRWLLAVFSMPTLLGLFAYVAVPESPRWLSAQREQATGPRGPSPVREVFRPPLLKLTLLGICLGTIPLLGGWASGNWIITWSDQVGAFERPELKAWTQVNRALGATFSSLAGAWLAGLLGRRLSYFLISLGSLAISVYIFYFLTPLHPYFGVCAFALGFISGFYFGWLPLCLPEMFPTRVRSTGAGVTFNFGRVTTAIGILGAGWLMWRYENDYARVGGALSMIYAVGMIVILFFRPDESGKKLTN